MTEHNRMLDTGGSSVMLEIYDLPEEGGEIPFSWEPSHTYNWIPAEYAHVVATLDAAADEKGFAHIHGYGKRTAFRTFTTYKYIKPGDTEST